MLQRLLEGALGGLVGLMGVLHGLLGMFMPSLVIFFSVADGGGAMRVGGLFV
jgi:hypothetical protein